MLRRALFLFIGLLGAAAASQGPAFMAAYERALAARIAELDRAIVAIERDAAANLGDAAGAPALRNRRADLAVRRDRLSAAWPSPLLALPAAYDRETADAALFAYRPAPPATLAAAGHALAGFFAARLLTWLGLAAFGRARGRPRPPRRGADR